MRCPLDKELVARAVRQMEALDAGNPQPALDNGYRAIDVSWYLQRTVDASITWRAVAPYLDALVAEGRLHAVVPEKRVEAPDPIERRIEEYDRETSRVPHYRTVGA